jgi:sulfur carrier protein
VKVFLNGEERDLSTGTTVAELIDQAAGAGREARGVAVAIDAEVVPRSAWAETELSEGQHVELLAAIQGGS